jgi:hypothetical protein
MADISPIWVGHCQIREADGSIQRDGGLLMAGSILFCGIAILMTVYLIWRSEKKKAAVGRRCGLASEQ